MDPIGEFILTVFAIIILLLGSSVIYELLKHPSNAR